MCCSNSVAKLHRGQKCVTAIFLFGVVLDAGHVLSPSTCLLSDG